MMKLVVLGHAIEFLRKGDSSVQFLYNFIYFSICQCSFFTPGWALWFMLSVFLWKMFLPDMIRIKNAFIVSLVVGILSRLFVEFGAFMSLARTITFLPYFLAGYYCNQKHMDRMKTMNQMWSIVLLGIDILQIHMFN